MPPLNPPRRILALLALAAAVAAGAQGTGSLSWSTGQDWRDDWEFPAGTLDIGNDGTVRPRAMRKPINASLNAGDFVAEKDRLGNVVRRGGILAAGSNGTQAPRVLDGRADTWWSPSTSAPLTDRWLEIDLGRMVTATHLVLQMRPDLPLDQFAVYVADGREAFFPGSGVKDYRLVGRTTEPNRKTRLEYELTTDLVDGDEVPREHVRFVFLELTSTEPGGIAEIEVRALGDNVMLGVLDRFGSLVMGRDGEEESAAKVADGIFDTRVDLHTVIFDWRRRGWMRVDLGSLFWLDTIRIIGDLRGNLSAPMLGYKLFVSDGSVQPSASGDEVLKDYVWQEVANLEQNPPPGESSARAVFENTFTPRRVRYIMFSNRNNEVQRGPATQENVAEVQAFGSGYVPGATLTTRLIDLGNNRNLTSLRWTADTPTGTSVEMRTRTGDRIEELAHYFCRNGQECSKRDWDKEISLFGGSGPEVVEQRPDTTWSGWSRAYAFSGEGFLSPSPRRYLLVQAKLVSLGPDLAPALRSVQVTHAPPLAQELKGAILPQVVSAAAETLFSYVIEAGFRGRQPGFDQVLLRTPSRPTFVAATVGGETFTLDQMDSVYSTPESLWVQLPQRLRLQTPAVVRLDFRTAVLDDNTRFEALVGDSRSGPGLQRVDPASRNADVVRVTSSPSLLTDLSLGSGVVTPNDDGVNDALRIDFRVARLQERRPVEVTVHSLDGRQLRLLDVEEAFGRTGLGGRYTALWDGRDAQGALVPPGTYLCRVVVKADAATETATRVAAVAY